MQIRPVFVMPAAALCLLWGCRDQEAPIPQDQLPVPVRAAFFETYPDATVMETLVELEGNDTFYEVTFVHDGRRKDAKYAADGRLVEIEERFDAEDLPPGIRRVLAEHFGDYQIRGAERENAGVEPVFEVRLSARGLNGTDERRNLKFLEDGTLLTTTGK